MGKAFFFMLAQAADGLFCSVSVFCIIVFYFSSSFALRIRHILFLFLSLLYEDLFALWQHHAINSFIALSSAVSYTGPAILRTASYIYISQATRAYPQVVHRYFVGLPIIRLVPLQTKPLSARL